MNYIISNNAKEISKELFNLGVPDNNEISLLRTVTHPETNETALSFNLDEEVLIHPDFNVTRLIELTDYTIEQQEGLQAYFESVKIEQFGDAPDSGFYLGRFPFNNIVVGYADIKDRDFMDLNGWFPKIEDIN